ncbi:transmembrane protein 254-like [Rhopilema esculentum]|uniref:transmembrane protein 254-like n=1 Tax=Rhopilema esculentum TaxID=499914 RepID=UPI0031CDD76C
MADSTVETLPKDSGFKPKRHIRPLQENTFRKFAEEDDHFESSSLLYYVLVTVALVSFEILCFQTSLFPFERLGGAGKRLKYLTDHHLDTIRAGFLFAVALHIFEAIYANFKCRSINMSQSAKMKWTIQTFIIGYASLRLLNSYCEKKTSRKKMF